MCLTRLLQQATIACALQFAVFAQDAPSAPALARDSGGIVTITCATPGAVIRYSIDGSDIGPKSGPYLAPIILPHGGTVKTRALTEDRKTQSELTQEIFPPIPGASSPPTTLVPCTQDRDWPVYDWAKRHAVVAEIVRAQKPPLIFIGDSITQMFGGEPHDRGQPGSDVWNKFYAPRHAANLGFGYDYIENTIWRLQHGELEGAAPKAVVLLIGTNNVGKNSSDEIVMGIRAILTELHTRVPHAKVLLLGILPRGEKPDAIREKLAQINTQLAQLDGQNGVTFLDLGAKLLQPDGSITRETMSDFLHPTAQGYTIWAEAMEPVLAKLLGETGP
jgi:lysophospholipase L1-like esterase